MVGSIWLSGITVALISSVQVNPSGLCPVVVGGGRQTARAPGMCAGVGARLTGRRPLAYSLTVNWDLSLYSAGGYGG